MISATRPLCLCKMEEWHTWIISDLLRTKRRRTRIEERTNEKSYCIVIVKLSASWLDIPPSTWCENGWKIFSGICKGVVPQAIPLLFRPELRMPDLHPAINVNRLADKSDINIWIKNLSQSTSIGKPRQTRWPEHLFLPRKPRPCHRIWWTRPSSPMALSLPRVELPWIPRPAKSLTAILRLIPQVEPIQQQFGIKLIEML